MYLSLFLMCWDYFAIIMLRCKAKEELVRIGELLPCRALDRKDPNITAECIWLRVFFQEHCWTKMSTRRRMASYTRNDY